MSGVFALLTAAVVGMLAILIVIWWNQERIVFQPPLPPFPTTRAVPRVEFRSADGQELFGYLVGDTERADRLVIAFHGNADLAVWLIPWAQEVHRRTGAAVFLPEYRGYAGLAGRPTYAAGQLDARAAFAYARDTLGFQPSRIILFGHSLGSAIASELALEAGPAALVLQSPLSSARDMARIVVAAPVVFAWRLISRVHYDTEKTVGQLGTPVWVAHGKRDLIIPFRMGERVHEAARVKGEMLALEHAGHNDLIDAGGEQYWRWLARAITQPAAAPQGDS